MRRRHVLIVNRDAALLDGARALLQDERYNVSTTSFVPTTTSMIAALAPDVTVVDLALDEPELWAFVERLLTKSRLQTTPVIITAADLELLDQAQSIPRWAGDASSSSGRFAQPTWSTASTPWSAPLERGRRGPWVRCLAGRRLEAVADAGEGGDERSALGLRSQLGAQPAHPHPQVAHLVAELRAPDAAQQLPVQHHPPGVGCQLL
jgi:CheY-like chemotaxis protein